MPKRIVIDVPDWVDNNLADKLKKKFTTKTREEIERDYADTKLYSLFTLRFPETGSVDFDFNEELNILRKIRKKGKERVE